MRTPTTKKLPRSRAAGSAHEARNVLAKIYVKACQLSGAHLTGKAEFLSKLEDSVLLLQPRDATKEEVTALCRFLQHRKTPELLDVVVITRGSRSAKAQFDASVTGIHPRVFDRLCQCLAKSSSLRTLVVHDFPELPNNLLKKLLPRICSCENLTSVCFRNIPLHDSGLLELAPHLESSVIRLLILQKCSLTDESILTLQKLLKCHAAKRDVHVWNSTLRDYPLSTQEREASSLRATQVSAVHGILALDLSNNDFTDTAGVALSNYLANDVWLCGINLARNKIGPAGLSSLVDVAVRNENLSALGLTGNPGRREMDDLTYTELSDYLDSISMRVVGAYHKIETLMPSEVRQVLSQWKENDETLRGKPNKQQRRSSPASNARRKRAGFPASPVDSQSFLTNTSKPNTLTATTNETNLPIRVAWGLAQPVNGSELSSEGLSPYPQSSGGVSDGQHDRFTPSPPFMSDYSLHGCRTQASTTMTNQSVQTNDSDEVLASPSRLTDGRPPSRLSLRPRVGLCGSHSDMHSPLLALGEDEFGGSHRLHDDGWLTAKHVTTEQEPEQTSYMWESVDVNGVHDLLFDDPHIFSHSSQQQQHQQITQREHRHAKRSVSPPDLRYTVDSDNQSIHQPHLDWQHSGNLQKLHPEGSIEKLSQEVGRLSLQLQELTGQFQSLQNSITITSSTMPAQLTSPSRLCKPPDDGTTTLDLNDQLLRSHVQERLTEKLKQLLLSDNQR